MQPGKYNKQQKKQKSMQEKMKYGKSSEKMTLFVSYVKERKSEVLIQREHLC